MPGWAGCLAEWGKALLALQSTLVIAVAAVQQGLCYLLSPPGWSAQLSQRPPKVEKVFAVLSR